jgi:molybdenum cofactor cytidylyltransferase
MSVQNYRTMDNTAIIILAAGNSTRFGSSKQLLHFNGKTLLQHAIDESTGAGANPVVVVVGANANEISASIDTTAVEIVLNNRWEEGMASGIVAGVRKAGSVSDHVHNIIIAVCDQPFISSALFKQLYQTQTESYKGIVACSYADTIGTPVLFTQKYFDHLLGLHGDEGAKKLLTTYATDVATVHFPKGNFDIDTKTDYQELLKDSRGS